MDLILLSCAEYLRKLVSLSLLLCHSAGSTHILPVVMKSKTTDAAVSNWLDTMSPNLGVSLAETLGLRYGMP